MSGHGVAEQEAFAKAELLNRLGGDRELFDTLIAESLTDLPLQLGELRRLLAGQDITGARQVAHDIVGIAGYLCARPLTAAARALDRNLVDGCPRFIDEEYASLEIRLLELVAALRAIGR